MRNMLSSETGGKAGDAKDAACYEVKEKEKVLVNDDKRKEVITSRDYLRKDLGILIPSQAGGERNEEDSDSL